MAAADFSRRAAFPALPLPSPGDGGGGSACSGSQCRWSSSSSTSASSTSSRRTGHRDIAEELAAELLKRRQRKKQGSDSRALGERRAPEGSDNAVGTLVVEVDPHGLFRKLKRKPRAPPVSLSSAERLVRAMEGMLKDLKSPVIDIAMPEGQDPRVIIVGDTHGQLQDVLHVLDSQGPPSPTTLYLFNGDIVDRGRFAVEIWLLIITFKLRFPKSVHVLRGNHENDQMINRPFRMGGGFAEEVLSKYSRSLLDAFSCMFKMLPLFAVVANEVFVVHGGLFRDSEVTLARLRALPFSAWRRNYPDPPPASTGPSGWTNEEALLFDAQWADPHYGCGSRPSTRGRVAVTFGEDVTRRFLDDAGLRLCIRSHRVPQSGRGAEYEHGGRLLTVFTASRYGGVLRNRGSVAVLRPLASSTSSATGMANKLASQPTPPLLKLRLSLVEHDIDAVSWDSGEVAAQVAAAAVCQVRRMAEEHGHARQKSSSLEEQAIGLINFKREELLRKFVENDLPGSGCLSRVQLGGALTEVCGHMDWCELLDRWLPHTPSEQTPYFELLRAARVRWCLHGPADIEALAKAAADAEIKFSALAAIFDVRVRSGGVVTPHLARAALRQLLPSLRDRQYHQLANALFGGEPLPLSAALHQLALFAAPPQLQELWMQPALRRLAACIQLQFGPPPLHAALLRFFTELAGDRQDVVEKDEFVAGMTGLEPSEEKSPESGDFPSIDELRRLFDAIDSNRTGTVSFLELLLAMDERQRRPELPQFPALEGALPAMLFAHQDAVLRGCRVFDHTDGGFVSADEFLEVAIALADVIGRPLGGPARAAFEEELRGGDLCYAEVMRGFEATLRPVPPLIPRHRAGPGHGA